MTPTSATVISSPPSRLIGILAGLCTVAIWSGWLLSTRFAASGKNHADPVVIMFLRFSVASLILAPWWIRGGIWPRGVRLLPLIGLLCAGVPFMFFVVMALQYIPVAEGGALLPGTLPLIVVLLSALLFGERLPWKRIAGYALIAAGVATIVGHGLSAPVASAWQGQLFMLGAAASMAIFTLSMRRSGLDSATAVSFIAVWSLVLTLPFLPSTIMPALRMMSLPVLLEHALVQGLFACVLATVAYGIAIARLGPSSAAAITAITPATALLAGIPVLGEWPDMFSLFGCAATACGVILASGVLQAKAGKLQGRR